MWVASVQACGVLENGKTIGRIQANKNRSGAAICHSGDAQLVRWVDGRVPQLHYWDYGASLNYS